MSHQAKFFAAILGMGGCLLLVSGCGQSTGDVSGKVTYKGQAVTSGSINFNMKGKGIAQDVKLDTSGSFTMPQSMPVGTYQVVYVPPAPEPRDPAKGPPLAIKSVVPQKFQKAESSGLSFEVKAGKNDIPIEFKD